MVTGVSWRTLRSPRPPGGTGGSEPDERAPAEREGRIPPPTDDGRDPPEPLPPPRPTPRSPMRLPGTPLVVLGRRSGPLANGAAATTHAQGGELVLSLGSLPLGGVLLMRLWPPLGGVLVMRLLDTASFGTRRKGGEHAGDMAGAGGWRGE